MYVYELRSTKGAHKLKVLPEQPDPATQSRIGSDEDGDEDDEEDHLIGKAGDGDADADDEDAEVGVRLTIGHD
jgi:hypothetical protein